MNILCITLLRGHIFLLKGATKANQGGIPSLQAELEWTGCIQFTEMIDNGSNIKTRKCLNAHILCANFAGS